jgi:hypothetical protein
MESNQRSSQKKASALQAILPARFSDGPLPAFAFVYTTAHCLLIRISFFSADQLRLKSGKTMVD